MTDVQTEDGTSGPRRALVTGAASELGQEIVLTLVRDGYDVALTYHETSLPDTLMSHPDMAGITAVPVAMELLSQDSIDQGFDTAVEALGGLDVLVNNAGRPLLQPAIDVTWEEWDTVLDVNLKAAYFLSSRLARHCIDAGRPGAIVNVASTHGLTGFAKRTVYGISKGGMIQMTRMLAIEWAALGVRVNAVAPSTVLTDSRRAMYKKPGELESMLARIPAKRFVEPGEVAAAVRYLAGSDAASITGHTLVVDGGLTAA
ncbi:MAG: SDR family oxidoreductase [Alphaproteobacteria bacterium]|nr:SDR family oxidoreductase [Alphaproteobacteria bacterium]